MIQSSLYLLLSVGCDRWPWRGNMYDWVTQSIYPFFHSLCRLTWYQGMCLPGACQMLKSAIPALSCGMDGFRSCSSLWQLQQIKWCIIIAHCVPVTLTWWPTFQKLLITSSDLVFLSVVILFQLWDARTLVLPLMPSLWGSPRRKARSSASTRAWPGDYSAKEPSGWEQLGTVLNVSTPSGLYVDWLKVK